MWKAGNEEYCNQILYYHRDRFPVQNGSCIPKLESANCVCRITLDSIIFADEYRIVIWSSDVILANITLAAPETIKPKRPENLTIETEKMRLSWKNPYDDGSFLSDELIFQVHYKKKGDPEKNAIEQNVSATTEYVIISNDLEPGVNYTAKVRVRSEEYKTDWSDWSEEVEFHSGSGNRNIKIEYILIPAFCVLLVILIFACFFCYTKLKVKWWDNIPKPITKNPLKPSSFLQSPAVFTFIPESINLLQVEDLRNKNPSPFLAEKCPGYPSKDLPVLWSSGPFGDMFTEDSSKDLSLWSSGSFGDKLKFSSEFPLVGLPEIQAELCGYSVGEERNSPNSMVSSGYKSFEMAVTNTEENSENDSLGFKDSSSSLSLASESNRASEESCIISEYQCFN
ncbi:interleukin-4 receptor subunit alpha-like isoform X2 [Latimeria chalumnae]|nr:PREDICTED: interleukin-4 receptor subunit alpha-like isoform X2 [Latimeria chalumnae]|eukprot:XP_006008311.1 PREDICTED: interleukin-4 receptor subunit alpha-like isoform X2 [Latimeria chalumnae]